VPLRDTRTVAVVAAVVGSRQEAELIVGMLKGHGIRAAVSADDAGGADLALQAQGVRVLVREKDVSKTRRLLQNEPPPGREPNSIQRLIIRFLGGSAKG
jgi:hypothetical protein